MRKLYRIIKDVDIRPIFISLLGLVLFGCEQQSNPNNVTNPSPIDVIEPALPALPTPTQAIFSELFAAACPMAPKVNSAACQRESMGSSNVICEYGLGTDEYLRNEATLTKGNSEWVLQDVETICASGA